MSTSSGPGGSGPLVVLLHGWPVCSWHWRHLMPALDAGGFAALAIDLKGLGESGSADSDFAKATIAREVGRLIADARPDARTFAVVGHDWGGSVAIALAALEPKRVSHLVVEEEIAPGLEAPLPAGNRYPTWHGALHRTAGLPEALIRGNEDRYLGFFLELRHDPRSLSPEDREHFVGHLRSEEKTRVALGYYRSYAADAAFFRKRNLRMPVLAIGGKHAMGPAVQKSLCRIASRVSGLILSRSGHYPAEEEPEKLNRAISKFLDFFFAETELAFSENS